VKLVKRWKSGALPQVHGCWLLYWAAILLDLQAASCSMTYFKKSLMMMLDSAFAQINVANLTYNNANSP
jgi:hypothetical protein